MSGEWNAFAAKCEEHALEVQCMFGLADDAKSLCARVVEFEELLSKNVESAS